MRKEFEAEYAAKIAEAKEKIAAEAKINPTVMENGNKTPRKTKKFGK